MASQLTKNIISGIPRGLRTPVSTGTSTTSPPGAEDADELLELLPIFDMVYKYEGKQLT